MGLNLPRNCTRMQQSYMEDCECLVPEEWAKRPRSQRFLENVLRLMSPVL